MLGVVSFRLTVVKACIICGQLHGGAIQSLFGRYFFYNVNFSKGLFFL